MDKLTKIQQQNEPNIWLDCCRKRNEFSFVDNFQKAANSFSLMYIKANCTPRARARLMNKWANSRSIVFNDGTESVIVMFFFFVCFSKRLDIYVVKVCVEMFLTKINDLSISIQWRDERVGNFLTKSNVMKRTNFAIYTTNIVQNEVYVYFSGLDVRSNIVEKIDVRHAQWF